MPMNNGDAVDSTQTFDFALIRMEVTHVLGYIYLYVESDAKDAIGAGNMPTSVGSIGFSSTQFGSDTHDPTSSELAELIRRFKAGNLKVRYGFSFPGIEFHDLAHGDWVAASMSPFSSSYGLFEQLAELGGYTPATTSRPAVFEIPGIVSDQSTLRTLTFFKRGTSPPTGPEILYADDFVAFVQAHLDAGFSLSVPDGYENLYRYEVEYGATTAGIPWTKFGTMQVETGFEISWEYRVHNIAKAFKAWEDELTETQQGNAEYTRIRNWYKLRIGHAYWLADNGRASLSVISAVFGAASSRTISGHDDVMEWATEDIERFAINGIGDALDCDDALLTSLLGDRTVAKIKADDTFGEGVSGNLEADVWNIHQVTNYPLALNYEGE